MKRVSFCEAVATLVGMIIGAGILGVPYVIAQVGTGIGFCLLLVLGLAALLMNLMFTEVVMRTEMRHQIAGYAKKYLGVLAYRAEIIAFLLGGYGALTAYLIGEGEALSALFGGDKFVFSLIFFFICAAVLFVGLNLVKVFELWMVVIFLAIILVIFGVGAPAIDFSNWQHVNWSKLFLPYGVILFAYGGAAAIVPMREILRRREKLMKRAVLTGSIIPIVVYVVFALVVVGVTGLATTEIATIGLGQKIGSYMTVFGNLFAVFAMGTSFLTIGLTLKEFLQFDFKIKKHLAWLLAVAVPLIIFLIGERDFIEVMGVAGSLTFGITGIVVVLSYWKAKKIGDRQPEFSLPKFKIAGSLLILMFAFGIGYTAYNLLK